MSVPHDYLERVYAGVLGKIIGVYIGRPFEGWWYDRITERFGEIDRYVNEDLGVPLVVSDDDISGTFTFLRAMPDHGNSPDLTPAQIGESWLNYLIERKTILWWGGLGNSTEHTAYLRLKHGIEAPASGSIAVNGKVIAEQIGAQIFIDGWGMICPGDPERAVDYAKRAGSVSHDGEAVYGAQIIAAIEAMAFNESNLNSLLDNAIGYIPADSVIARVIHDVRDWHAKEPDWRKTREQIAANYGYDKFGGACHMVPNHALIIHALLHGDDDFSKTQLIVNTAGWDTDCNAANVGCILGVKNGLAAFDNTNYDWRGPVADRMYLISADGGRAITDAVQETFAIVNIQRALAGDAPLTPKDGARFTFAFPGSVQGFTARGDGASLENVSTGAGERALALRSTGSGVFLTPTFLTDDVLEGQHYEMLASPTVHPGQNIVAKIAAASDNTGPVTARLVVEVYGANDARETVRGPETELQPGAAGELRWTMPDTGNYPIASIGLETDAASGPATVLLDSLGWSGSPTVTFARAANDNTLWRRAWVGGVSQWEPRWPEAFHIAQNEGTGLVSQGTADWVDYTVSSEITISLAKMAGVAARINGLRRWYALVLSDDGAVKLLRSADGVRELASAPYTWSVFTPYDLSLSVRGGELVGSVNGKEVLRATDDAPLPGGAAGLLIAEGNLTSNSVSVTANS